MIRVYYFDHDKNNKIVNQDYKATDWQLSANGTLTLTNNTSAHATHVTVASFASGYWKSVERIDK
jgi:hypothetical protein